jgi:hypothetical protein
VMPIDPSPPRACLPWLLARRGLTGHFAVCKLQTV